MTATIARLAKRTRQGTIFSVSVVVGLLCMFAADALPGGLTALAGFFVGFGSAFASLLALGLMASRRASAPPDGQAADLVTGLGQALASTTDAGNALQLHVGQLGRLLDEAAVTVGSLRATARRGRQGPRERAEFEHVLSLLYFGVALVDANGNLIAINEAAEDILAERDGLQPGPGGLMAIDDSADDQLRGAISACARGRDDDQAIVAISVPRKSGRLPYLVLSNKFEFGADQPAEGRTTVLLLIVDPEQPIGDQESVAIRHVLMDHYGLTPAEARVTFMIVQGMRLDDIADQLGIGVHPARTHLKRVFEKLGVERQAELVMLYYSYLGPIRVLRAPGLQARTERRARELGSGGHSVA